MFVGRDGLETETDRWCRPASALSNCGFLLLSASYAQQDNIKGQPLYLPDSGARTFATRWHGLCVRQQTPCRIVAHTPTIGAPAAP